eukprot:Opistho-1_new@61109
MSSDEESDSHGDHDHSEEEEDDEDEDDKSSQHSSQSHSHSAATSTRSSKYESREELPVAEKRAILGMQETPLEKEAYDMLAANVDAAKEPFQVGTLTSAAPLTEEQMEELESHCARSVRKADMERKSSIGGNPNEAMDAIFGSVIEKKRAAEMEKLKALEYVPPVPLDNIGKRVVVTVCEATGLLAKDKKSNDPYCTIECDGIAYVSDVKRRTLNPEFDCVCKWEDPSENAELKIQVWGSVHHATSSKKSTESLGNGDGPSGEAIKVPLHPKDNFLGIVVVPLKPILTEWQEVDKEYKLQKRSSRSHVSGNIHVIIKVEPIVVAPKPQPTPVHEEKYPKPDRDRALAFYPLLVQAMFQELARRNRNWNGMVPTAFAFLEDEYCRYYKIPNIERHVLYLEHLVRATCCGTGRLNDVAPFLSAPLKRAFSALEEVNFKPGTAEDFMPNFVAALRVVQGRLLDSVRRYKECFRDSVGPGFQLALNCLLMSHKLEYRIASPDDNVSVETRVSTLVADQIVTYKKSLFGQMRSVASFMASKSPSKELVKPLRVQITLSAVILTEYADDSRHYRQPILEFCPDVDVFKLNVELVCTPHAQMLRETLENMALDTVYPEIFELYDKVRFIVEEYFVGENATPNPYTDYHVWFTPFVQLWLQLASERFSAVVQKATFTDPLAPLEELRPHSMSVDKIFRSVGQNASFIDGLAWPDGKVKTNFYMKFADMISTELVTYTEWLKDKALAGNKTYEAGATSVNIHASLCAALNNVVAAFEETVQSCAGMGVDIATGATTPWSDPAASSVADVFRDGLKALDDVLEFLVKTLMGPVAPVLFDHVYWILLQREQSAKDKKERIQPPPGDLIVWDLAYVGEVETDPEDEKEALMDPGSAPQTAAVRLFDLERRDPVLKLYDWAPRMDVLMDEIQGIIEPLPEEDKYGKKIDPKVQEAHLAAGRAKAIKSDASLYKDIISFLDRSIGALSKVLYEDVLIHVLRAYWRELVACFAKCVTRGVPGHKRLDPTQCATLADGLHTLRLYFRADGEGLGDDDLEAAGYSAAHRDLVLNGMTSPQLFFEYWKFQDRGIGGPFGSCGSIKFEVTLPPRLTAGNLRVRLISCNSLQNHENPGPISAVVTVKVLTSTGESETKRFTAKNKSNDPDFNEAMEFPLQAVKPHSEDHPLLYFAVWHFGKKGLEFLGECVVKLKRYVECLYGQQQVRTLSPAYHDEAKAILRILALRTHEKDSQEFVRVRMLIVVRETQPDTPATEQPVHGKTHVANGHHFKAVHFHIPTGCMHCGKVMSGIGKQGYACGSCGFVCHKKCHVLVPICASVGVVAKD